MMKIQAIVFTVLAILAAGTAAKAENLFIKNGESVSVKVSDCGFGEYGDLENVRMVETGELALNGVCKPKKCLAIDVGYTWQIQRVEPDFKVLVAKADIKEVDEQANWLKRTGECKIVQTKFYRRAERF